MNTNKITLEEIKDLKKRWKGIYESLDKRTKGAKESKVFVDCFVALEKEKMK
jgi:hypothetical protein